MYSLERYDLRIPGRTNRVDLSKAEDNHLQTTSISQFKPIFLFFLFGGWGEINLFAKS